ncbi:MAG: hypothetical protein VZR36_04480 [Prevotella sp.]|nr:hypothetical protein [Prevotella sp.]
MKKVKAIQPRIYKHNSNFKLAPYKTWTIHGGATSSSHYNMWFLHRIVDKLYRILPKSKDEARLIFAEPASLDYDCFPSYYRYEIIPVLWDCWPDLYEKTEKWFVKYNVKSAVFTSSQTANVFRNKFPRMNILTISEGIETCLYNGEKTLKEREIDFLSFGRVCKMVDDNRFPSGIRVLSSKNEKDALATRDDLISALSNSRITLCVPRCDNQPEIAKGVETLTQRYWECMLSGVLIIGRAPQELIDIIGYDPVIKIDNNNLYSLVKEIIDNVETYQELANKNKMAAMQYADWNLRIKAIRNWLMEAGYEL